MHVSRRHQAEAEIHFEIVVPTLTTSPVLSIRGDSLYTVSQV